MRVFIFVFLITLFIQQSCGVYFFIKDGQKKCFLEDLPNDTEVIVFVNATDIPLNKVTDEFQRRKDTSVPLGITAEVTQGKAVVLSQSLDAAGRFAFTSREAGEHSICIRTNSSRWFSAGGVVRIFLIFFLNFFFFF